MSEDGTLQRSIAISEDISGSYEQDGEVINFKGRNYHDNEIEGTMRVVTMDDKTYMASTNFEEDIRRGIFE